MNRKPDSKNHQTKQNAQDKLCDEDCNNCPIIRHPNNRLLTKIMNEALDKFGAEFYCIVQRHCPNLTCCYDCQIDDFCHVEGCKIIKTVRGQNMNNEQNSLMSSQSDELTCYVCGADQAVGKLARMLGHRPDIAYAKLRQAQKSFENLWDSLTDILTQDQIDRIERLHKDDLENLFMST